MKLAVVMDPIERIKPEKDGTLDLLLSAQSFGYELTRVSLRTTQNQRWKTSGHWTHNQRIR